MILILYAHTNSGTDVARRLLPSVGMCALDAEREVRLKAVECLKSALARLESESAKMSDDLPLSGGGVVQVFECVCWYTWCACVCFAHALRTRACVYISDANIWTHLLRIHIQMYTCISFHIRICLAYMQIHIPVHVHLFYKCVYVDIFVCVYTYTHLFPSVSVRMLRSSTALFDHVCMHCATACAHLCLCMTQMRILYTFTYA